jgi:hypothetical protein
MSGVSQISKRNLAEAGTGPSGEAANGAEPVSRVVDDGGADRAEAGAAGCGGHGADAMQWGVSMPVYLAYPLTRYPGGQDLWTFAIGSAVGR